MKTRNTIVLISVLAILGGIAYYFLVYKKQKEIELLASFGLDVTEIENRDITRLNAQQINQLSQQKGKTLASQGRG